MSVKYNVTNRSGFDSELKNRTLIAQPSRSSLIGNDCSPAKRIDVPVAASYAANWEGSWIPSCPRERLCACTSLRLPVGRPPAHHMVCSCVSSFRPRCPPIRPFLRPSLPKRRDRTLFDLAALDRHLFESLLSQEARTVTNLIGVSEAIAAESGVQIGLSQPAATPVRRMTRW